MIFYLIINIIISIKYNIFEKKWSVLYVFQNIV
jgi:hypothetical protein